MRLIIASDPKGLKVVINQSEGRIRNKQRRTFRSCTIAFGKGPVIHTEQQDNKC